jgi:hypothetical protein
VAEAARAFGAAWVALRFWVANFPTLLRLTWLPVTLLSLAGYGWAYWNSAADLAMAQARASGTVADPFYLPSQQAFDGTILWATLQLIALSAAAVAVHRFVIAGERRPGEYFAFAFGRAELGYFAMGVASYVLVAALVAGQFLAQFQIPPLDAYVFSATMKPYTELGPFVLSLFIWPGEAAIFELPPPVYAAWCALVIATGAVLIRIAPWPATVAAEQNFALGRTFALTRGRTLTVVAFFAAIGIAVAIALAVLGAAGLSSLAFAGPEGLGGVVKAMTSANDFTATPVQNVEIRAILSERSIALYQEIARFLMGLIGITLGATLLAHLYLALRRGAG